MIHFTFRKFIKGTTSTYHRAELWIEEATGILIGGETVEALVGGGETSG